MACFIVPATEAVVTTVAQKFVKNRENKKEKNLDKIEFSTKLSWLNKMLWGGSALLAFEHIWHGEVVPFYPFLTAVKDGNTAEMLGEMKSVGVSMAVVVTFAWFIMVLVSNAIENRRTQDEKNKELNLWHFLLQFLLQLFLQLFGTVILKETN